MPRFAYFTLHLQMPDDASDPAVSTGVVEDLATGEKRRFSGGRELLEALGVERGTPNMPSGPGPGQTRGA